MEVVKVSWVPRGVCMGDNTRDSRVGLPIPVIVIIIALVIYDYRH